MTAAQIVVLAKAYARQPDRRLLYGLTVDRRSTEGEGRKGATRMTNDQQRVIENLHDWSNRNNAWAAQIAKTKLREYEAKTNRDIIRRRAPANDRRAS